MEGFLRKIWVVLFAFMIFGLLAWVPIDKWQKSYLNHYRKFYAKPQEHIDKAYKYADYVGDGGEPNIAQQAPEPHIKKLTFKKYYTLRHRKPYFIRDKRNPRILYPYRG